jgi:hypothetical protein
VDQPKQGFDMAKLEMGDKLVMGGAALYFIWIFMPAWYKFSVSSDYIGFHYSSSINGFRGFLIIAWLLSIVAIAEVVVTKMADAGDKLPAPRGLTHLIVAGVALFFTLLGLLVKPTFFGVSWGIFVGLVFSLVWTWGAFQIYQASQGAAPAAGGGTDSPPPPPQSSL